MKVSAQEKYCNSTADIAGQKILGTSGSLMSYIYTGNAFTKNNSCNYDTYSSTKSNNKKILKTGLKITAILAICTSILLFAKKGLTKIKRLEPINPKI